MRAFKKGTKRLPATFKTFFLVALGERLRKSGRSQVDARSFENVVHGLNCAAVSWCWPATLLSSYANGCFETHSSACRCVYKPASNASYHKTCFPYWMPVQGIKYEKFVDLKSKHLKGCLKSCGWKGPSLTVVLQIWWGCSGLAN